MSLNDLFYQINHQLGHVQSMIGGLQGPDRYYIDKWLTAARSFGPDIDQFIQSGHYYVDRVQSEVIKYIIFSFAELVDEYDLAIRDTNLRVEVTFRQYYDSITRDIESAIALVNDKIDGDYDVIWDEIAATEKDILDGIDAKLAGVEASITTTEKSLLDKIEDGVKAAATLIADKAAEIWTYVTDKVSEWVTKFNQFYTTITNELTAGFAVVYERLRIETSDLLGKIFYYYDKAKDLVNAAKAYLVSKLNALDETLRAWVNLAIAEVKSLMTDLSMMSDWRFQLFNLSLSYPELGFLQVLNRDAETFSRFKPYWQALFARVMEED